MKAPTSPLFLRQSSIARSSPWTRLTPLLTEAPERTESDGEDAIEITKEATLVVDGRKSNGTIRESVEFFTSVPDIDPDDGWSSKLLADGSVKVSYSFWNGEKPETATWRVILKDRDVRYTNLPAKRFSWLAPE